MNFRQIIKSLLPPAIIASVRSFNRLRTNAWAREWVCIGNHWPESAATTAAGWDDPSVAQVEEARMNEFARVISSTEPFTEQLGFHNSYMVFGCVLGRAAQGASRLSMLDYGGGAGRYLLLAGALQPSLDLAYTCKEVPVLCQLGRRLHPTAHYLESETECFAQSYDLVMASTSMHYAQDWRALAANLAAATRRYLLITRLPVLRRAPSYVVRQRPYRYGYRTEYLCWFLNRNEFLQHMARLGMKLEREFLLQERPQVSGAPEQCEYAAFLFTPAASAKPDA